MARESTSQALREIRALYALGPIGGVTDAQLLGRFVGRGEDAEEAFAALVQRHGPMVLGVCRRMLGGDGAEDAFQAVFLVLARRAGSVRRRDGLKAWLYGVAVRTAKEARRRAARRRAREGAAMDVSRAGSAPDGRRGEDLALLDEELNRLPERLRVPLVLCELEGISRQDAARQLGLPEGTLSSRLARGRALLRDRLARRGVALGAGGLATLLPEPAVAALPGPLADATVRLAFSYTAGAAAVGTVPAAVASLADGVLTMISLTKWKLALAATAIVAAGLTVAWAAAPGHPDKADEARPAASARGADAEKPGEPHHVEVRGVVVDEAGRPVAGAEIRADPFTDREARGSSGPDGSFAIPIRRDQVIGTSLLARDGDRLGTFQYAFGLTKAEAQGPARVVLKPGRAVAVRVADARGSPVAGASVEAAGSYVIFAGATTSPDGSARLRVPADARVDWVRAVKPGAGFDYAEFGEVAPNGQILNGVPAGEVPAAIDLAFGASRTARIKAVDRDGRPLAGVGFIPWMIQKEGRRSQADLSGRTFVAMTGADGIATFDWLPPSKDPLQFWPAGESYPSRRIIVEEGATAPVVVRMVRTEAIRGRVTRPDGSPAPEIKVIAFGSGWGVDNGQGNVRTAADGSYAMQVGPGEAYVVYVEDDDWAAPSHLGVAVREQEPAEGVDFHLTRGTVIRGALSFGPADRPVAEQFLRLTETGGQAPKDLRAPGDDNARTVQRTIGLVTDARGRYSVRVGPGTYNLSGPTRMKDETIAVKDEAEIVRDFHLARPEKGKLSGRVVLATDPAKGVAGARVEFVSANIMSFPFPIYADADGRFRCERSLDRTTLCAKSPDGALGAIVEIGPEDPEVVLPVAPTASATGLLLDEQGKPAANQELMWGRMVYSGEEGNSPFSFYFVPKVKTDAQGRFTLPSLVVGQEYPISVMRDRSIPRAGVARPEKPGPLDLGTIRVGADRPSPRERAAEMSSFRPDAPDAGAVAPPIEAKTLDGKPLTLADFQGKYVLIDFWATWCGPCIAEIPGLQSVHEAFADDDRFAILSVSVDETIDEPRKFQEERKLPWNQAFLAGGMHGDQPGKFGVRAIPAFVLVGPDGKIIARGMRGDDIKKAVAKALAKAP